MTGRLRAGRLGVGQPMSPRQFDWLLRTRGPGLHGWPAAERSGALLLLDHDERARHRLAAVLADYDDAPGHDADLHDADLHDADLAALARIRCHVQATIARRVKAEPTLRWSMRGGAMAACLLLGLWAGGALDHERDPLATVQVAALEALQ